MRFQDFRIGKKYTKKKKLEGGGGRSSNFFQVYNYIVVAKDQDREEILAAIVPEVGKPTAPQWYQKAEFARWKPL